jgi:type I restriction enzyme S subunit
MSQDLYDLPAGWDIKHLTDVVEFIGGSQPPKSEFSDICLDGYVRLIQIRDYKSDDYIVYVSENSTKKFCNYDDVMIGRYGPPVFQILRGLTGAYNVALMKAEPDQRYLTKDYLYWFLQSSPIQNYVISISQRAAGQSGVNKQALEKYEIPLPPLAEQTRIVEKLDAVLSRIDTAIDELQQSFVLVDAMFDSYLSSLSYETVKLGDLVNITTGRLDANAATDNGEFTFFTCSRETYRIDNYAFDCEAILLAGNNAVGDFNVKHFKGKFNAYQRTYVITVKDNNLLLYRFLYFQLVESMLKFKNKSIGSGTKFLKIGMIKDLDILLPNLTEQQKVVEKLDALNEKTTQLKTEIIAKIGMFNQLKASVLDGAFRGEV